MTSPGKDAFSTGAVQILNLAGRHSQALNADDMACLVRHIDQALDRLGLAGDPALTPNMQVQAIADAADRLLQMTDQADLALFLLDLTPEFALDLPPICFVRLNALAKAKGSAAALAELAKLLATNPPPEAFRFGLYSAAMGLLQSGHLQMNPECHRLLWGTIPDRLDHKFLGLASMAEEPFLPQMWVRKLLTLRGSAPQDDTPEFVGRLQWSILTNLYLASIISSDLSADTDSSGHSRQSPGQAQIRSLSQQRASIPAESDLGPLVRAIEAGRSIVVLQSHAGMRGYVSQSLYRLGMPLSLVGNGDKPAERPGDFHLSTSDLGSLPFQFATLTKLMRKDRRIVRIFPDGRQGGDGRRISVLGIPVEIGMGGSLLAYHGNSALFFANTRWTGMGFSVDFTPGPLIGSGTSKEDCDRLFADFYAQGLTNILLGPPEDMGCFGGFWPQIFQET